MERKISFADVKQAVEEAYENVKSIKEGSVDPRVALESKEDEFAISLVLTDGRAVDKDDVDALFPLGPIAKVPLSAVLLSQNTPEELVKKSGHCLCSCHGHKKEKMDLPFGRHGVRAVSAVVPQGDPEGKMSVINDMIVALSGSEPGFSDTLYETFKKQAQDDGAADQFEKSGYYLYDAAPLSIDVYSRLLSMKMSVRQVATMGATVAADGRNPLTGEYAFDGKNAQYMVAMMATRGKHFIKPWMMLTGLPAKKSFTGGILAVLPGFGAIAAYSPRVDERGISIKAAKAIEYISQKLGLSVYASARVEVEK